VYTLGALALLLLWLGPGNRAFFTRQLAPLWLEGQGAPVVEWWSLMYQFGAAALLFGLVPALLLKVVARERLLELGLGLGDWRAGLAVMVLGLLLVALPGGWSVARMPEFQAEYPMAKLAAASAANFVIYQLAYGGLYYLAYETFFRGFLQLGLARSIGHPAAILVQTAVTTLLHIGKPDGEIWSALLAGVVFGLVVVRTRAVWPLVLVHWALGAATDFFCARAAGLF
jgi:membrane protease YdiL (CAAX protease family)